MRGAAFTSSTEKPFARTICLGRLAGVQGFLGFAHQAEQLAAELAALEEDLDLRRLGSPTTFARAEFHIGIDDRGGARQGGEIRFDGLQFIEKPNPAFDEVLVKLRELLRGGRQPDIPP